MEAQASSEVHAVSYGGGSKSEVLPVPHNIENLIRSVASDFGFQEVERLIKLGHCESRFNPICGEINHKDCTNTTNGSFDRGWFQISRKWHPEVTDECSVDIKCSTVESIRIINEKGFDEWACNSLI